MTRNKLTDLNDYLFGTLEELMDPKTDDGFEKQDEDIKKDINKAKTICEVARVILENTSIQLEALKVANDCGLSAKMKLPETIEWKQ